MRSLLVAAALVGGLSAPVRPDGGIPGHDCYRTVEETYATAEQIVADHPRLASWSDIGDSWEKENGLGGYDLRVLRLTNAAVGGAKPKLVVTCSMHPREYAPAELCTRFAERLVEGHGVHPDITWILDRHEVHLILLVNPDGRKQAEAGAPWRKNTNQTYCGAASENRGADLNRNFEFAWGCCGASSDDACSEYYRGPEPASEPETQAVEAYLRAQLPDQRGPDPTDPAPASATGLYLDVHSAGKLVLWPWGFGVAPAPNAAALRTLGRKLAWFNGHQPKQFANHYLVDGTAIDFAYGDLGVAAFLYELGSTFFQDCASFEEEILPENLDSLLYAAKVSRLPYLTPSGPDSTAVEVVPGFVDPGTIVEVRALATDERYSNANGSEPSQNVAAALAWVGSAPWGLGGGDPLPMSPADGALDAPVEQMTTPADTAGLAVGGHLVWVRSQDAAGNLGALSATFLWIRGGPEGTVAGSVSDLATGLPLEATIEVDHLATDAVSDPLDGSFTLALPAAPWTLHASALHHHEAVVGPVAVADGETVVLDFALPLIDADADGVTDVLDCARDDPGLWSVPGPSDGLRLARAEVENVQWEAPPEPGSAAGPSYDLLRSLDPADFGAAVCLESAETDTVATDTDVPGPGVLHAYLVRAANACGSTLGTDSTGTPRSGAACR